MLLYSIWLPPLMTPLVLIADIDKDVILVTIVVVKINRKPCKIPAWPTTQLKRKNNITPQILSRHRIRTPFIQPNFSMLFFTASISKSVLRFKLRVF